MTHAPQHPPRRTVWAATAVAAAALFAAGHVSAAVTFYEREEFRGPSFNTALPVANFGRQGFNDRASSAVVSDGSWEVCEDARFGGRCSVLRPGRYPSLTAMGLNDRISSVRRVDGPDGRPPMPPPPVPIAPRASFFEQEGLRGRMFTTVEPVGNLDRQGFNEGAASAEVSGGTWQVCEDPRYGGRCTRLSPGRYPTLASMGLQDRVASVRAVEPDGRVIEVDERPRPAYDARRRGGERLYQADVTSVRAVVGPPAQRCWVEREQVGPSGRPNVGAAIAGALIGGILGHQVGGGTGRDLATAGGAIAGAAIGANVNRDGGEPGQDVQRCAQVDSRHQAPAYWDVSYSFRGVNHRVQMSSPPQATLTVNAQGEPRV